MHTNSLIVVGSGITFYSHLTIEAIANIKQSEKILYLANDAVMEYWIQKNRPDAESLANFYNMYPLRLECYKAITKYILENVAIHKSVCVVFYGHPTILAKPALDAVIMAEKKGYVTKILPGISAEDCLFADLLVNPGTCGCLSYEATDLLIHTRHVESSCNIILWQVGIIGALGRPIHHNNLIGIETLQSYLYNYYDAKQPMILYEAAQVPHFEPKIIRFRLEQLTSIPTSINSTLYIPPARKLSYNPAMLKALKIDTY